MLDVASQDARKKTVEDDVAHCRGALAGGWVDDGLACLQGDAPAAPEISGDARNIHSLERARPESHERGVDQP